jgi:hypothetical protein
MSTPTRDQKPNLVLSILQSKCTRCRRGDMFEYHNPYKLKYTMKMNDKCPVCGQPLDMEPGFYYGTNMISYALAVIVSVISLALWWLVIGFSLWWLAFNAILLVALQPPLMRISRTVWLAFFVKYSPRWKEGDIVEQYSIHKEHQNNW